MKTLVISIFILIGCLFSLQEFIAKDKSLQEHNEIIIYGSDSCHYCLDTKSFLKANNVKFKYYDVDISLEKEKEMINKLNEAKIPLSNLSLPVIDKKGEIFTNTGDFKLFLNKIIKK